MGLSKRLLLIFIVAIVFGLINFFYMPREDNTNNLDQLRIGSGDDITSLVLKKTLEVNKSINLKESEEEKYFEYTFKDCWNNTAQWALSSDEIDMAFYCNHMAVHLVRSNDNFEIYGPVIMNAEVIAYKSGQDKIPKLGVGQKREHLKQIAKDGPHQVEEVLEMSPISLPYTLETGEIDGAILDITKASLLAKFSFMPLSEDDYISYSLVVRKDIVKTKAFNEFLKSYNKVVEDLNNVEMFKKDIIMPDEFWDKSNIKFLNLE